MFDLTPHGRICAISNRIVCSLLFMEYFLDLGVVFRLIIWLFYRNRNIIIFLSVCIHMLVHVSFCGVCFDVEYQCSDLIIYGFDWSSRNMSFRVNFNFASFVVGEWLVVVVILAKFKRISWIIVSLRIILRFSVSFGCGVVRAPFWFNLEMINSVAVE